VSEIGRAELWVPATAVEPSEMIERLIRAEIRAARAEEALRWLRDGVYKWQKDLIDRVLGS
jgi:hypothetical protein